MKWLIVLLVIAVVKGSEDLLTYPELVKGGQSRIVSGWEANEGQFPHQISIRMVNNQGGVFACGGTVIHNEWALTAAHCTALRPSLVLRLGSTNLTRPALIFETTEYYNHPRYIETSSSVQVDDIGVIKFPFPVEYSALIQPIRLQSSADKNRNYEGYQMLASGWGNLWTQGASPEVLNWVYLRGLSNIACWIQFSGSNLIQDSTICGVGFNVTSQSTCQGDSGGPLTIVDDDGKLTQIGISSFVSVRGCHVGMPAGFVRPGHYLDWIEEVTGIIFDSVDETEPTESNEEKSIESGEEKPVESNEEESAESNEEKPVESGEEKPVESNEEESAESNEEESEGSNEDDSNSSEEDSSDSSEEDSSDSSEDDSSDSSEEDSSDSSEEEPSISNEEEEEGALSS